VDRVNRQEVNLHRTESHRLLCAAFHWKKMFVVNYIMWALIAYRHVSCNADKGFAVSRRPTVFHNDDQ